MLDIKLIRENPEFVKSNLQKRGNPENLSMLHELIETDKKWRENLTKLNDLRHDRKVCTQEIATLKKAKQDAQSQVEKAKATDTEITCMEKEVTQLELKTHEYLMKLPNILHETVPFGTSDADNVETKKWGKIPQFTFTPKSHID
jgi:seryl-tRNA synthetase